ncbi:unnamed protein product [Closterium sp. Naga37s-1]|nr:unnamed protein product [Closterium sp. Naga37s-1]
MPPCHCHHATATVTLPPCHCHRTTATVPPYHRATMLAWAMLLKYPAKRQSRQEISGASEEAATTGLDIFATVLAQVGALDRADDTPGGCSWPSTALRSATRTSSPSRLPPTTLWWLAWGVHPSIFINPSTFHLTVHMLKLWSPLRVQAAADALQAAMPRVQEVLGNAPLVIRRVGLVSWGHPSKAHVLYADMHEVDGGNRLSAVCEFLRQACREAGLVTSRDCRQPLKPLLSFILAIPLPLPPLFSSLFLFFSPSHA